MSYKNVHYIKLKVEMYRGYIKLWRKTKDWAFYGRPLALALWITLLTEANHKSTKKIFKGKVIEIKAGQLLTGRRYLAQLVGISESTIERYLKRFENEQQLTQQSSSTNRLITILNWYKYQEGEQQKDNRKTTERQQKDTPKNVKNGNNEKNKDKRLFSFDEIYLKYPKRIGRKAAERHFNTSVKTQEDWDRINLALNNYLKSKEVKGGYIQNASTWFNNWGDWVEKPQESYSDLRKEFGLKGE